MIPQRELAALRAEWTLDQDVIEKDYILGWLLAGIAHHDALNRTWIFKGGTCLRKCYYETFRLSEDLDFTVVDGGPEEPAELARIFLEIADWIFDGFWNALPEVFSWLAGTSVARVLRRAEFGDVDPTWEAPQAMTSWRRGVRLELLRYAGANRLMVDIDYRAEQGRQGSRRVEPYALRRTRDGNLVVFVVNDYGQLRSYRVDRIAGIRPTTVPFVPRFRIEF